MFSAFNWVLFYQETNNTQLELFLTQKQMSPPQISVKIPQNILSYKADTNLANSDSIQLLITNFILTLYKVDMIANTSFYCSCNIQDWSIPQNS